MRRLIYIFMAMFVSLAIVAVHASTFKPPKPAAQNATSVKPAKKPAKPSKPSKPSKPKQVRCNECGELVNPSDFNNSSGMCDDCDEHQRAQAAPLSELMSSPREFDVNGVKFTMVPVRGGTFTMGATAEQGRDADGDEKPSHQVTLGDYWIGETEVTETLWMAVMGSNPSKNEKGYDYPVEFVSWEDCQKFISKLNALTGETFRLPTEAEWEYAARGGNKSKGYKFAGGNTLGDVAWYDGNSGQAKHPVATKAANELGLYDMSGNVYEWCQDWYSGSYYSSSPTTNPTGPSTGSYRVLRGGGGWDNAGGCRVSYRNYHTPTFRFFNLGLRLALSDDNAAKERLGREAATDSKVKRALSQSTSGKGSTREPACAD